MAGSDNLDERREQIRSLLTDAITVLCKNTMLYCSELSVEGLLGITTDKKEIFLVNIKEIITNQKVSSSDTSSARPSADTEAGCQDNQAADTDVPDDSYRYSSSERSPSPQKSDGGVYSSAPFSLGPAAFPDVITIKDEPSEVVVSNDSRLLSPDHDPPGIFINKDLTVEENPRPVIPTLSPQFRSPLSWSNVYANQHFTPTVHMPPLSSLNVPMPAPSSVTSHNSPPEKPVTVGTNFVNRTEDSITVPTVSPTQPRPNLAVRSRVQKTSDSHVSLGKNIVTDRYYCSCGQQFRHSSSLTRHLRMNDQAKRGGVVYKCHLCGSKMNRRDNLRSHLIKNHGVKFGTSLESTITQNSLILTEPRESESVQNVPILPSHGLAERRFDDADVLEINTVKSNSSPSDDSHIKADGHLPISPNMSDEIARLLPQEEN